MPLTRPFGFCKRHDAAKANGGGDARGNLRPCEISGCSDESKTRCFVIQNKAAQLRAVATGARCCSFTGTAQVWKERVGGERDRGLRLEFQKRRAQGLVRLGGSPGWVAQLGKGALRQRGQGAGDEG